MSRNKIWVIDDDRAMRWVLEKTFKEEGFDVTNFEEAQTALERLHHDAPDVILTDIRMPGIDGLTFLSKVKNSHPDLPVIIMTAHSDLESAVSSYQTGAFEYLPKPFDIDEALALVNRAILHINKLQQQEATKQLHHYNQQKLLANLLLCKRFSERLVVYLSRILPF